MGRGRATGNQASMSRIQGLLTHATACLLRAKAMIAVALASSGRPGTGRPGLRSILRLLAGLNENRKSPVKSQCVRSHCSGHAAEPDAQTGASVDVKHTDWTQPSADRTRVRVWNGQSLSASEFLRQRSPAPWHPPLILAVLTRAPETRRQRSFLHDKNQSDEAPRKEQGVAVRVEWALACPQGPSAGRPWCAQVLVPGHTKIAPGRPAAGRFPRDARCERRVDMTLKS